MSTVVIVVAAGSSVRFGGPIPKLLVRASGRPLLQLCLETLDACAAVDAVVLVASAAVRAGWDEAGRPGLKIVAVVPGGASRQASVRAGLAALPEDAAVVLVHDGARPFASAELVARVAAAALTHGAAVPVLPVHDTVKRLAAGASPQRVDGTVPRESLGLAQTPQGFRTGVLLGAHAHAEARGLEATDDSALVEAALAAGAMPKDVILVAVPGEVSNVKVTQVSDVPASSRQRVGLGHDVHPLARGRAFVLAGVDIWEGAGDDEIFGPVGHSDGDALTHATCDALLGAAGLGDIGQIFPDTDSENEGRASLEFLEQVVARVAAAGWRVVNVSAVVKLERPRLAPLVPRMRAALAAALAVPPGDVGLSAKRGEGLGDVGEGRSIRCDVVALLERR